MERQQRGKLCRLRLIHLFADDGEERRREVWYSLDHSVEEWGGA